MLIRSAKEADLPAIIEVCNSAEENHYTVASGAAGEACRDYFQADCKIWLCIRDTEIVGVGVVDMANHHIPVFIMKPGQDDYECDHKLQELLLDWFYASRQEDVTLETNVGSTAEQFFLSKGWVRSGIGENGVIRLTITRDIWQEIRRPSVDD